MEAERWTFGGIVRQTFSDNLFLTSPSTPSEAISGATLNLTYSRIDRHSSFSAGGWAGGSLFNRFDVFNSAQYGLGVFGQVSVTPRARLRLGASYADGLNLEAFFASRIATPQLDVKSGSLSAGFTFDFTPSTSAHAVFDGSGIRYRSSLIFDSAKLPGDNLTPADVLAPLRAGPSNPDTPVPPDSSLQALGLLSTEELRLLSLDYRTWRAGTGLVHEFSPETRVTLDFGYRRTYVTPQTLAEGEQLEGQAALREVLDDTANLSLSYGYQESRFQLRFRTHAFTLQGVKQFSQKVKADASIGVSYLDGPVGTSNLTFIGGAGFSARFKRTLLMARYTRTRYQGLINGDTQVSDVVFASLGHTLTRQVFVSAYGLYSDGQDELSPLYSYERTVLGASLSARIKKRGSAGVSYSFLRFNSGGLPAAESSVISLFFGYSRTEK